MEKIGKSSKYFLLLGLLLITSLPCAYAQNDVSVEATVSNKTVYTGGRIRLSITVNGSYNELSLPELPEIKGLDLINPTPSTSRRFSYINGVSKTSYTYSYYLSAPNEGTYTIPAASITIDGAQYQTQPITVNVVKRNAQTTTTGTAGPDIFLKMKVSDRTVIPGQQIIANVVLYFKRNVQVNTYQPVPGWKAEGFWKERFKRRRQPEVESVVIDGMRYNKAKLLQFALFATKKGELTLSPYQVNVVVQTRSNRGNPFSSFFGGYNTDRRKLELKTDSLTIQVNALPPSQGSIFTGAVGSFSIQRHISQDTVTVGETFELTTTISGTGNIPLLTKPNYQLPSELEVYKPQTEVEINRKAQKIKGQKIFTDIVVPRNPGTVTIPAVTLSWYSLDKQQYVTKQLPAKEIFVKVDGDGIANTSTGPFRLSPITGLANWVTPSAQPSLASYWWFWVGLIFPLIAIAVGYWRKTYNAKMANDYHFARSKKAKEVADAKLQQAIEHAENDQIQQAYHSLQQAITGFIGDKLRMDEAGLSVEAYIEALKKEQVDKALVKNVKTLLDKCATINYAPEKSGDYLKSHVNLARSIIKKLKNVL